MRSMLVIAAMFGACASTILLALDHLSGSDLVWMDWQMPGIAAAYLFWGAAGSSVGVRIAICGLVNAVVYGLPAFAFLMLLKFLGRLLTRP